MDEVITLISNVGFPIAACIFMAYMYIKQSDTIGELTTTLAELKQLLEDRLGGGADE